MDIEIGSRVIVVGLDSVDDWSVPVLAAEKLDLHSCLE